MSGAEFVTVRLLGRGVSGERLRAAVAEFSEFGADRGRNAVGARLGGVAVVASVGDGGQGASDVHLAVDAERGRRSLLACADVVYVSEVRPAAQATLTARELSYRYQGCLVAAAPGENGWAVVVRERRRADGSRRTVERLLPYSLAEADPSAAWRERPHPLLLSCVHGWLVAGSGVTGLTPAVTLSA
ncbi:hypothetical protein HUT18_15555 [Streptomyces sp. NA04227]|uniref:hypothetical protein n=1 Tax=Streptomyces sp. NA04227 TaxID=2742136 RepID=UPI001591F9B0|nr:hypothetical protein [Streptomyces sp. NA04227]QKW07582.1 hypothetical protein HUT18_15555 [Streptomyces sp. NA04227]